MNKYQVSMESITDRLTVDGARYRDFVTALYVAGGESLSVSWATFAHQYVHKLTPDTLRVTLPDATAVHSAFYAVTRGGSACLNMPAVINGLYGAVVIRAYRGDNRRVTWSIERHT